MNFWLRFALGLLSSALVAFAAHKKKALSGSGSISAAALGAMLTAFGGWELWVLMILFFLSAGAAGLIAKRSRQHLATFKEHSGPRNIRQVAANGGPALLAVLLGYVTKNPVWLVSAAAAFSEATADTLASELGVLSKKPPVSIVTGKRMEPGVSGAVSGFGFAMSFLGALLIASVSWIPLRHLPSSFWIISLSGFLGSLIDSLLGATIQAKFRCNFCGATVEKPHHHGQPASHTGGWRICGNNLVNFLSGLCAVVVSALLLLLF